MTNGKMNASNTRHVRKTLTLIIHPLVNSDLIKFYGHEY